MRWVISLSARAADVERLATGFPGEVMADPADASRLSFEMIDPEGGVVGSEAPHAAKAAIDTFVERLNGVAKLRWGRVFEGVSVDAIKSFDAAGKPTLYGFVEPGVGHMEYEDFEAMKAILGFPGMPPPEGLDLIRSLDLEAVAALAETNGHVTRALHLLRLALIGDDFDWVTAYAALEVVQEELGLRGRDGRVLGWWTTSELRNFKATANSPDVLGHRARHGRLSGLSSARMIEKDATWFVRRVIAHWVTDLLVGD